MTSVAKYASERRGCVQRRRGEGGEYAMEMINGATRLESIRELEVRTREARDEVEIHQIVATSRTFRYESPNPGQLNVV